jgi:hypothetical protein
MQTVQSTTEERMQKTEAKGQLHYSANADQKSTNHYMILPALRTATGPAFTYSISQRHTQT